MHHLVCLCICVHMYCTYKHVRVKPCVKSDLQIQSGYICKTLEHNNQTELRKTGKVKETTPVSE